MNQRNFIDIPKVFTSLLYICGFFIFLEWIYPIEQLTDTNEINLFIYYAAFCFLISLLQVRWWQSFILKGLGMFFILHLLFFTGHFLELSWVYKLIDEVVYNIEHILARKWYGLTNVYRSLLFLLLIWLVSYLIHYWFIIVKRILLFMILTIVYLSVSDTFTAYDAALPVIRVFIISFIALGMTNFFKEIQRESIPIFWWKKSSKWLIPIVFIVFTSALIGYLTPKPKPIWPDPVPFIQSAAGTSGDNNEVVKKVGYGEDDSQLGGSFVQDHERVFEAMSETDHYWRIETKDMYTGKGWENASETDSITTEIQNDEIPLKTFSDSVETDRRLATIEMSDVAKLPKLVYPYGIFEIGVPEGIQLKYDDEQEAFQAEYNDYETNPESYSVVYEDPSFNIDDLKNIGDDPEDVKERYTTLPEHLPDRVQTLAEEITNKFDTRYEKASAIEKYFGQSGEYTYETEGIPVPQGNQDYVDQFLFQSKKGYCDNYSTSMVVMLRTLGIPARWAKGFTGGEIEPDAPRDIPSGYDMYEVTNANAHSWAEVYFPDVGWVPFEPTQGFTNPVDMYTEVDAKEDEANEETESSNSDEPEVEEADENDSDSEEDNEETAEAETSEEKPSSFTFKTWRILLGMGIVILSLVSLYIMRFRIQTSLLEKKMKEKSDNATYQAAYHFLLKILAHKGNAKKPQQTLREYAKEIDVLYSTQSMRLLTYEYEHLIYNKDELERDKTEFLQTWKKFIDHVLS